MSRFDTSVASVNIAALNQLQAEKDARAEARVRNAISLLATGIGDNKITKKYEAAKKDPYGREALEERVRLHSQWGSPRAKMYGDALDRDSLRAYREGMVAQRERAVDAARFKAERDALKVPTLTSLQTANAKKFFEDHHEKIPWWHLVDKWSGNAEEREDAAKRRFLSDYQRSLRDNPGFTELEHFQALITGGLPTPPPSAQQMTPINERGAVELTPTNEARTPEVQVDLNLTDDTSAVEGPPLAARTAVSVLSAAASLKPENLMNEVREVHKDLRQSFGDGLENIPVLHGALRKKLGDTFEKVDQILADEGANARVTDLGPLVDTATNLLRVAGIQLGEKWENIKRSVSALGGSKPDITGALYPQGAPQETHYPNRTGPGGFPLMGGASAGSWRETR